MNEQKIIDETRQRAMKQCYDCAHRRSVPGNTHIACANPDDTMEGNEHGKRMGWWFYPMLFDPTWNLTICKNHKGPEVHDPTPWEAPVGPGPASDPMPWNGR